MAGAYSRGLAKFLGLPVKEKTVSKELHKVQVFARSKEGAEKVGAELKKSQLVQFHTVHNFDLVKQIN